MSARSTLLALLVLCLLPAAAEAQSTYQAVDDFETGAFGPTGNTSFQQGGLPTWSVMGGVREVNVNLLATASLAVGNLDDGLEMSWSIDELLGWQSLGAMSYPLPDPIDLTFGGIYDRFMFRVETSSSFFVAAVVRDSGGGQDIAGPDNGPIMSVPGSGVYEIPFSYFAPEVDLDDVERVTLSMFGRNTGDAKILSFLIAGPLVMSEVETPDYFEPIAPSVTPAYFEEWHWPDLPDPGPVSATLQISMDAALTTGGTSYPGDVRADDNRSGENFEIGTVSGMWVEAPFVNPPGGSFTLTVEWQDTGGAPMFYPPDPVHVGNKLGVLFVQSRHLNFDSGNETMLQHAYRLEIPEATPLSLTSFFAYQPSATSFELQFELAQIPGASKRLDPTKVFELTSDALAGPVDLSTAAPIVGATPGPSLSAWPNVTDGITQLNLSQARGQISLIDIHDLRGRRVRRLQVPSNGVQVEWDGRDDRGHPVNSGMYLARMVGESALAAKIVLLK